ncbi:MAG: hypothetical protein DRQ06_04340 [Candidatus Hydrothermota bacterium]|nr:MAG: hypothetical protein DRQ06_04340 [Candidatus Hydrothermae bacterium]
MALIRFGTGGVPHSAEKRTTEAGLERLRELGLDHMEVEFVRGVKMKLDKAREIGNLAGELGITLTAHGPYYINLNSPDENKRKASVVRILDTARAGYAMGARSITFHAAYYGDGDPEDVYVRVRDYLYEVLKVMKKEGIEIDVRPETTGKPNQFGTLDEIIRLSSELPGILPCVDFAHIHARYGGKFNSYDEFIWILRKIERALGRSALENLHMHMSGIEYGDNGEINHLNLEESDFRYRELLKALRDKEVSGYAVCESPNLEEDAQLLKRTYDKLRSL